LEKTDASLEGDDDEGST